MQTRRLPDEPDAVAPDGSQVRVLLGVRGGGLAHFELAGAETAVAVRHRTVEEVWYVLSGRGEIWRRDASGESVVALEPGVSVDIPLGAAFQFRASGAEPLRVLGATMPPWPGPAEAVAVDGPWVPTVAPGAG